MKYLNVGCGSHFHPDWTNVDFVSTQEGVIAHDLRQGIPFEDASFDVVYHSHVLEHFTQGEAERFLEECHRVLRPKGLIRVVVPNLENLAKLYLKYLEEASQGATEAIAKYDWILLEMFDQIARHQSGGEMATYLADENIPNESFIIERIGIEGEILIKLLRPVKEQIPPPFSFDPKTDDFDEVALKVGKFRLSGEVHQWMYDRYSLERILTKTGFTDVKVCEAHESRIANFEQFGLDVTQEGRIRKPDSLFVEAVESRANYWSQVFVSGNQQTNSLKVAQLNTIDVGGGAARAAYRLHKGLQQAGQKSLLLAKYKLSRDETVGLVQSLPSLDTAQTDPFTALQTHYINNNRTDLSNTLFNFPYPGWDMSQAEEVQTADIIQLHWVAMFQSPQTLKRLASLGKPIVWTLHDMWGFTGGCHYAAGCEGYQFNCNNCPQLKADQFDLAAAILQDKLDLLSGINLTLVTPSYWLADCVRKSALFKHQRVEVIPNGVEIDKFIPIPKAKAKESLGIKPNTFTLLIGADNGNEKRKGFEQMIKALEVCLDDEKFFIAVQQEKIKLLSFGVPNDQLNSLKIPVVSLGQINCDDKLAEIYSAADIFVLPSLEDNLPNTMLESMSCGTPVVGFEVGGLPDLVQDNITGKLVPKGDCFALAQAILSALKTPEKRAVMGENCRQLIQEKYSLSVQANAYLNLYKELLGNYPSDGLGTEQQLTSDVKSLGKKTKGIFVPVNTEMNSGSSSVLESVLRYSLSQELSKTQQKIETIVQSHQQEIHQYQHQKSQDFSVEIQQYQQHIQSLTEELEAMKTSKFWKLRSLWFKIKQKLGLPTD
ncbi:glycosyltransferase [Crocosphaera sp.]|uniref:glycosyltransferase n=1 Tax=Crocosphaera sp. TaxID=2729996 RepID=UPI0026225A25|nr:glycosyltransferase [Crocosphaera sp.]MDJ0579618.1 glycosyltransferase [Crocosphaera sp.]